MDAENGCSANGNSSDKVAAFSVSDARSVLAKLGALRLDWPKQQALTVGISVFERQLNSYEDILDVQNSLARELRFDDALVDRRGIPYRAHANSDGTDAAHGIHVLPDVFSVPSNTLDAEQVRALAWHAHCPQEAVRKEARAFRKAVGDRLSLAAKRLKLQDQSQPSAPQGANGTGHGFTRSASGPAATHSKPQQQQHAVNVGGQFNFSSPSAADVAVRTAQLAKLETLLQPETGGIRGTPHSAVGMFQQLLVGCPPDWLLRRALLGALRRTPSEVLRRLVAHSRVLGALQAWMQDAVCEQQVTLLRLLLEALAALPLRRDLLKGSRLEAALEDLAGSGTSGGGVRNGTAAGVAGAAVGAGAAAEDLAGVHAAMRRRFGAAAAAVLAEWRKDPDAAASLRRAGPPLPSAPTASSTDANGPPTASPSVPGAKFLGPTRPASGAAATATRTAAAAASASQPEGSAGRKRPLPPNLPQQQQRVPGGAERPRPSVTAGGGEGVAPCCGDSNGGGGSGGGTESVRRPPAAAAAAASEVAVTDMTAKLGEKGPVNTDVVVGFRSRVGDGSVRRSQLAARQPRAAAAAAPGAAGNAAPITAAAAALNRSSFGALPQPPFSAGPQPSNSALSNWAGSIGDTNEAAAVAMGMRTATATAAQVPPSSAQAALRQPSPLPEHVDLSKSPTHGPDIYSDPQGAPAPESSVAAAAVAAAASPVHAETSAPLAEAREAAAGGAGGVARECAVAAAADAGPEAVADGAATAATLPGSGSGVDAAAFPEADEEARRYLERHQQVLESLRALQAKARGWAEVVEAEGRFRRRQEAYRQARARRLLFEERRRMSTSAEESGQALRTTVPWVTPPVELLLPPSDTLPALGEESTERLERQRARQLAPKVVYSRKDLVPCSPAEPPSSLASSSSSSSSRCPAPVRPIPWVPSLDSEDGRTDWWRQNLATWEAGVRLPEYVLPPTPLHEHLQLEPHLLAPQYRGAAAQPSQQPSLQPPAQPSPPPSLQPPQPQPQRQLSPLHPDSAAPSAAPSSMRSHSLQQPQQQSHPFPPTAQQQQSYPAVPSHQQELPPPPQPPPASAASPRQRWGPAPGAQQQRQQQQQQQQQQQPHSHPQQRQEHLREHPEQHPHYRNSNSMPTGSDAPHFARLAVALAAETATAVAATGYDGGGAASRSVVCGQFLSPPLPPPPPLQVPPQPQAQTVPPLPPKPPQYSSQQPLPQPPPQPQPQQQPNPLSHAVLLQPSVVAPLSVMQAPPPQQQRQTPSLLTPVQLPPPPPLPSLQPLLQSAPSPPQQFTNPPEQQPVQQEAQQLQQLQPHYYLPTQPPSLQQQQEHHYVPSQQPEFQQQHYMQYCEGPPPSSVGVSGLNSQGIEEQQQQYQQQHPYAYGNQAYSHDGTTQQPASVQLSQPVQYQEQQPQQAQVYQQQFQPPQQEQQDNGYYPQQQPQQMYQPPQCYQPAQPVYDSQPPSQWQPAMQQQDSSQPAPWQTQHPQPQPPQPLQGGSHLAQQYSQVQPSGLPGYAGTAPQLQQDPWQQQQQLVQPQPPPQGPWQHQQAPMPPPQQQQGQYYAGAYQQPPWEYGTAR